MVQVNVRRSRIPGDDHVAAAIPAQALTERQVDIEGERRLSPGGAQVLRMGLSREAWAPNRHGGIARVTRAGHVVALEKVVRGEGRVGGGGNHPEQKYPI